MRQLCFTVTLGVCLSALFARADTNSCPPPMAWIDPDTGHRVVQLSREPGSQSLYFNLNPFTRDGERMIFTTPGGIAMVNLQTREIQNIVEGRVRVIMVGRKSGRIYFYRFDQNPYLPEDGVIYATDPDTRMTRTVAKLPPAATPASINADETLLAGTITGPDGLPVSAERANVGPGSQRAGGRPSKAKSIERRFDEHLPMELFILNLQTGKLKTFDRGTNWLNHLQFSPTDPQLFLFCHEGPWQKVDRIWTIRADGSHLTLVHKRTMTMEIAGHEFWGADGRTIWYDLQTPRGEDFWLAGYSVSNGARTWYHLQRDEWSVHYNVSPDGKLFCGDGGAPGMVAHASNGKWVYLFHPEFVSDTGSAAGKSSLIRAGVFHAKRLVNLSRHNYSLEPNAMFTPDGKWIVFRSNLSGASQVYAVEVNKTGKQPDELSGN